MINKKVIELTEERERREILKVAKEVEAKNKIVKELEVKNDFKEIIALGSIQRLKPCMDNISQLFFNVSEYGISIEYNFKNYYLDFDKDICKKFSILTYNDVLDIFGDVIFENTQYLKSKGINEIRINRGYIYVLNDGIDEHIENLRNDMELNGMGNIVSNIATALYKADKEGLEKEHIQIMKKDLIYKANEIAFDLGFEDLFITGAMINKELEQLKKEESE